MTDGDMRQRNLLRDSPSTDWSKQVSHAQYGEIIAAVKAMKETLAESVMKHARVYVDLYRPEWFPEVHGSIEEHDNQPVMAEVCVSLPYGDKAPMQMREVSFETKQERKDRMCANLQRKINRMEKRIAVLEAEQRRIKDEKGEDDG